MKKAISIILIAAALLCLCACGGTEPEQPKSNLSIVCTAFPQYDFVKNILGTDEGITLLIDDGGDLHSYEPTAQDIITIGSADIFICVGGISDEWVEGVISAANNPDLKVITMMDLVETYEEEYVAGMEHVHTDGEHATKDEHIWLSLNNAGYLTQLICDVICEIEPQNADRYRTNAGKFIADTITLDMEYKLAVSDAKRNVLLFADRFPFRYLTEAYGLEYYAAFAGCSSESEASFQTMAFLIDKTNELSLPVVLTIDGSDGSIAKTICESTGAKALQLDSCQSVSMADIQNGTTYMGIMRNNLEVLREALN